MEVKFKNENDILIVCIIGKLIGQDTLKARRDINQGLENQKKVIFDLSKITDTDGAGLGVLVSCLTIVEKQEGKIVFFGADKTLDYLLSLTKLKRVFTIFENQEEAVRSFSS